MFPLVLLLAVGVSDQDANAAVMYVQSYVTPALFEVCKSATPKRAAEFDTVLANWQAKNKDVVARGEAVAREQAKRDGTDVDKMFAEERDSMVHELEALTKVEQQKRCESLLQATRAEQ